MRKHAIVLAALALPFCAPAARAAGSWVFGVTSGVGIPTGDFASEDQADAKSGFGIAGFVDYDLNETFAIGVDGGWMQNKHAAEGTTIAIGPSDTYTLNKDKFKTLMFGVHGKARIPMQNSPLHPYALLGLGVYNMKEEWEETFTSSGVSTTDSGSNSFDSRFGGRVGVGATYMATPMVGILLEADYHFITEDKDKTGVSSLSFIGVRAGVSFTVTPK